MGFLQAGIVKIFQKARLGRKLQWVSPWHNTLGVPWHIEQTPEIVEARRKLAHSILQEIKIARNELRHNPAAVAMLEMWQLNFESELKPPPRH